MANRIIKTLANFQNKVLIANQKFFDDDILIEEGNIIRMNPIVLGELIVEYTRNGTDYYNVKDDTAQKANSSHLYRFPISAGDTFNVRIKGGTATTVKSFYAELWLEA